MHISTVNISQMVTDRSNITINIKYKNLHWLSIGIFRFHHGTFKGQGEAPFEHEYLTNRDREQTLLQCYCHQIGSRIWPFDYHIYICSCPILKVEVRRMLVTNISTMVTDRANITIAIKYDVTCRVSISIF